MILKNLKHDIKREDVWEYFLFLASYIRLYPMKSFNLLKNIISAGKNYIKDWVPVEQDYLRFKPGEMYQLDLDFGELNKDVIFIQKLRSNNVNSRTPQLKAPEDTTIKIPTSLDAYNPHVNRNDFDSTFMSRVVPKGVFKNYSAAEKKMFGDFKHGDLFLYVGKQKNEHKLSLNDCILLDKKEAATQVKHVHMFLGGDGKGIYISHKIEVDLFFDDVSLKRLTMEKAQSTKIIDRLRLIDVTKKLD